jgi:hypothetical protein
VLTGQALASIEETAGPRRRDQADTCPPGEESEIKGIQPITREQGTAPTRFVRVADEISLAESTHQIAASKSSGKLSACLEADCGWIGRLEEAIWGVSGEISQLSELDDVVNIFLYLLE